MPASMRTERYQTKVKISTAGEIIACNCKCRVSGNIEKNEKDMCKGVSIVYE